MKSVEPICSVSSPEATRRRGQKRWHESAAQPMLASFEHLAEALNAVRRLCPDLPVLAIQWLHPKHPIHPVQEELMHGEGATKDDASRTGRIRGWVSNLRTAGALPWRLGLCMLYAAHLSLMLVQLRWLLRREIGALRRRRFDLVAKTWCFGPDRSVDDRDFYYGDLQRRLAERGVRMLLLCGDASGTDWRAFAKAHVSTVNLCRLPELCLVPPLTPIWMVFKQLLASLRLRRIAAHAADPLIRRVSALASQECLSPGTTRNGLFFWIGRTVVRTWRPRAFITLYEGHGWEKCAWWGAKAADTSCNTVGYQHTVVHAHNISLLRPYDDQREHSTPDVVLCIGERTKHMMQPGHLPHQSQLITFGSFRRNSDDMAHTAPQPAKRAVLVVPEGHFSEPELLFDFAKRVAPLLPDHHFIFRCHPILPLAHFCPHLADELERFPNIEVSPYQPIEADFARSSVVLYRGSSSVLSAVLHGLKPIYFYHAHHHDVDPLFELDSWREYVSSANEMEQILRRYAATTEDRALQEWRSAAEYVSAYITAVDVASIDRFLTAVGLPSGKAVK